MKRCIYEIDGRVVQLIPAYQDSTRPPGMTDDEYLAEAISRTVPPGARRRIIDGEDAPADRTYREAWRLSDSAASGVTVDMPHARAIHLDRIRVARDADLRRLDVQYLRAIEADDTAAQQRIAAAKQALRDIPQTLDLDGYATPEALGAAWPKELS